MRVLICLILVWCVSFVDAYAAGRGTPCAYCYQYVRCLTKNCVYSTASDKERCLNDAVLRKQTCTNEAASYAGAGNFNAALRARLVNNVEALVQEFMNWQGVDRFIDDVCEMMNGCCAECSGTCGGGWTDFGTGYQKQSVASCQCGSCVETGASYRCAAGYYGASTNGTSGCVRCPNSGVSSAGTTAQTGCYVTSGTDVAGKYTYSSACYYTN